MKKVIIQILFEITDIEKESEFLKKIKNDTLSGTLQRDFSTNRINNKYFQEGRDFVVEKCKALFLINKVALNLNQVIWTLKFNISDIGINSTEFIEFKNQIIDGELSKDLTKAYSRELLKENNNELNFIPKNISILLNIK